MKISLSNYDIKCSDSLVISELELLKNDDLFLKDTMALFIRSVYESCYIYMKLEFLYNKTSKLYDYFISNHHDFWYINEFVKLDIEELKTSVNHISGLDELEKLIVNRSNDNHFMYEDIIYKVSTIMYSFVYNEESQRKFNHFCDDFKCIHVLVVDILKENRKDSPGLKRELLYFKNEYNNLLVKYGEFINNVNYIDKEKKNEINNYCLRLNKIFER